MKMTEVDIHRKHGVMAYPILLGGWMTYIEREVQS